MSRDSFRRRREAVCWIQCWLRIIKISGHGLGKSLRFRGVESEDKMDSKANGYGRVG